MNDAFLNSWNNLNDWEFPKCNFCGSNYFYHKQIYYNVKNTFHSLVECQRCKLRFYSPRLKFTSIIGQQNPKEVEKGVQSWYDNLAFCPVPDRKEQEQNLRSYYRSILQQAFNCNSKFDNLFEVGGFVGFFAMIAKEMGIKEIHGCEILPSAVKLAKEKFDLHDITCEDFYIYKPLKKLYDCGVMLDYIEHSYTPLDDLKKIYSMIKPKGTLILKTFLEDLDINRTMVDPIGHIHHFSGEVLKTMIQQVGFEILLWKIGGNQILVIGRKL